ncbi:MAG: prolyl oligopeptidase family serine peptidase [Ilumatobacter sp.]|uniref:S9 family peptidase n=2 Tax=Ilumatobacter sp. TaxID=1967498 RepID=UPI00329A43C1
MQPIPLSLIRAGRDLTEPRVSPDGRWVGFVQRTGGTTSIGRVAVDGDGIERRLTFGAEPAPGRGLGGGCFTWLQRTDGPLSLLYAALDGELWRQTGMHLERLTSHGRSARGPAVASQRPTPDADDRLVAHVLDDAEIWLIDMDTGEQRRIDDGRHAFCFDPAIAPDERIVSWQGWSPPDMAWDGAVRVDCDLRTGAISEWRIVDGAFQQPRFTPHGEPIHVHDGSGWLNVYIGDRPVVCESLDHAGPTWGMGNRSYALDGDGRRLAFVRNEAGHGALCVADLTSGEVEQLGRGVHGHLDWVGDALVAIRSGARTPTQLVMYRGSPWARTTLAHTQPDVWDRSQLPEPEIVEATSADGTTLHARRFVVGLGRMLVWVHGGPTDQWQVDWRPRILYWMTRGWDVLVVDPRGTTGHGRVYHQALHGKWGRLDVDDTADLIRDAHRRGWATPGSTVVLGGSSGGLTVLGVLADHPDLVAGGVASYPVSDLVALTEVDHRFEAHYTDTLVAPNDGSPESEAAFARLSPIHRAERITSPLLIFHGTDDPVVPISQSERLVRVVEAAGAPVEFVVYEGEGHGFRRAEHVEDEYERTAAFLDRVLAHPPSGS